MALENKNQKNLSILLNESLELVLGSAHELINLLAILPDLESGHGTDAALGSNRLQKGKEEAVSYLFTIWKL